MASRFWRGGTGTWDASDTTHWSATSGGAGGASVPGSSDAVTFDGSSGGGTVTVNFGGLISLQSITCGAFTGTLDFATNNNSVTLTSSMNGSGAGTRTINLGNGTWTCSASTSTPWNFTTTTGLTFNANSSSIVLSGNPTGLNLTTFAGGGLTYNNVTFSANSSRGGVSINGSNTFANLTITGPDDLLFANASTQTITSSLTLTTTAANPVGLMCAAPSGGQATISMASGTPSMAWLGIRSMAFTGGATFAATSSFDLGGNSGITIAPPTSAGGGMGGRIFTGQ